MFSGFIGARRSCAALKTERYKQMPLFMDVHNAEAANTVHRQAHGLVADEIYPVSEHA